MDPNSVREELAVRHGCAAGGAEAAAPRPAAVPAAMPGPGAARGGDLYDTISGSYFTLRRGLALLALGYPVALWLLAGPEHLPGSISA